MFAAILAAGAVIAPQVPDPALTPGAGDPSVIADVPLSVLCQPGYTSRPGVRHVTAATKRRVFAEYHIDPKVGGPYEVDHLCSLELGCTNSIRNLWPQSYVSQPWNAHLKDALENRLHALVCSGQLPLDVAQKAISTAWIAAYQQYVGPLPAAVSPAR